ncbi:MAG: hypothetical protein CML22_14130 [Rheinheimera sp.]|nr:hypothetical protein [Rheinheimera sp.]MBM35425.1 hypothetical protein [Rheinheimera sp.]|tara:strand:- start:12756 stop:14153 length:1398 start_codon:yes stop_codon:yes gene_type:complete
MTDYNVLENNVSLSSQYAQLMAAVAEDPQLQNLQIMEYPEAESIGKFYKCGVGTWPLIFSQARKQEFEKIISTLPALIRKAIRIYFGKDGRLFSNYLQMGDSIFNMLDQVELDKRDFVQRFDLLYSSHQCKVLEINAGTNLGLWEVDWLCGYIDEIFSRFPKLNLIKLAHKQVMDSLITALFNSVSRLKAATPNGNVLFITEEFTEQGIAGIHASFERVKAKFVNKFPNATMAFCHQPEQLECLSNNTVRFNGIIFDAVLVSHRELPPSLHLKLVSSFLAGKLHYPDNPFQVMIGNKLLMAVLHEDNVLSEVTNSEAEFIKAYIPWSKRLIEQQVNWEGKEYQLSDLLKEQQNRFVLKKGESMAGKDVIVGQVTDRQEWIGLIDEKLNSVGWLIQEFCPPDRVQNSDIFGFCEVEPVWGIYDFGQAYCGGAARAARVGKLKGVINAATGANIYLMAEAAKQKLSI